jgi:von Willebrand factor type A domain
MRKAQAEEKKPEDWEGEPSLKDLPGVLTMEQLAPKKASTPAGPPPEVGNVQAVRAPVIPVAPPPPSTRTLPVIEGLGPGVIQTNNNGREGVGQFSNLNAIGAIGGAIGGLGGEGGDYVGGLRKVGLDVALVIDATDSMQFVADSLKSRLLKLIGSLHKMVPTTRIGIVAYRDKGEEYVTKWVDLSFSTSKLQDFVSNLQAGGGGDWPEAVFDGLEAAVNDLKWRKNSKRVIVLVAGSPPHPDSVSNVLGLVQNFQAQGGMVSVLDMAEKMHEDFERAIYKTSSQLVGSQFKPTPLPGFYQEFRNTMSSIAKAGGGEFIPLTEDKALTKQIIVMTFGSRWQTEMAKYLRDLE